MTRIAINLHEYTRLICYNRHEVFTAWYDLSTILL